MKLASCFAGVGGLWMDVRLGLTALTSPVHHVDDDLESTSTLRIIFCFSSLLPDSRGQTL